MPAIMSAPPVPHVNAAIHDRTDEVNRATQAKKRRPTRALTHDALTASAAVVLLVVLQGSLPWISLGLALTFGFYGLVKKHLGGRVDALTGLTTETLVVTPVALGYLGRLQAAGAGALQGPSASPGLAVLLVVAGPVTAVPLLLFAAGTARVPLSVVGLSQYIAPTLQFLLAWAIFAEEISTARWIAMILVWAAVVVFIADVLHQLALRPRLSGRGA